MVKMLSLNLKPFYKKNYNSFTYRQSWLLRPNLIIWWRSFHRITQSGMDAFGQSLQFLFLKLKMVLRFLTSSRMRCCHPLPEDHFVDFNELSCSWNK